MEQRGSWATTAITACLSGIVLFGCRENNPAYVGKAKPNDAAPVPTDAAAPDQRSGEDMQLPDLPALDAAWTDQRNGEDRPPTDLPLPDLRSDRTAPDLAAPDLPEPDVRLPEPDLPPPDGRTTDQKVRDSKHPDEDARPDLGAPDLADDLPDSSPDGTPDALEDGLPLLLDAEPQADALDLPVIIGDDAGGDLARDEVTADVPDGDDGADGSDNQDASGLAVD